MPHDRLPAVLLRPAALAASLLAATPTLAQSASPQLELVGRVRSDTRGDRHTLVLLTVNWPFDVAATPAVPQVRGDSGALAHKGDDEDEPSAEDKKAAQARKSERRVKELRAHIVLDPELSRRTLRAALRHGGYGAEARRLSSLATRARSSAALPRLRLSAGRSTDETLKLNPTQDDPYRYTQSGGTDLFFEARATWRLDRLVFAREELAVERLRQARVKARAQLVERVLKNLVAWQRGLLNAVNPKLTPEQRVAGTLSALEAELRLNALTGGWFSRQLG